MHRPEERADKALLDEDQVRLLADLDRAADSSFLGGLCELFASDARQTLMQMRELVRHGDGTAVAREAHRLVGASATIGAAGFARDCMNIERHVRLQGTCGLDTSIEGARRQLEATVRALHGYIRGRDGAVGNAVGR
jgi:HPt (histidine-containing phosphotransfer) domain-containing protein